MSKYTAEQVRDYAQACALIHKGPVIAEMLSEYSALLREREADVPEGMAATKLKPPLPKSFLGTEDFCFCDSLVSLQGISGDGAPEVYLGSVRLKVNGKFVTYVRERESAKAAVTDGEAFSRGYVRGYAAALGAAASECRRQAGALDHGGNEYIRYADAIKCAAAIGSLRAPELNELSGNSGRLAGVEIPDGAFVIDRGFQVERGQSIPTVLVGFRIEDWKARDTFASMLEAPKPETEE